MLLTATGLLGYTAYDVGRSSVQWWNGEIDTIDFANQLAPNIVPGMIGGRLAAGGARRAASGARRLFAARSGGYGVLGFTEHYHRLSTQMQARLRSEILAIATDRQFVHGLFGGDKAARRRFFELLREAEVVGTRGAGGAAGLLKLKGEAGYRLRFALTERDAFLWIKRPDIIKHELGHVAREAKRLTHGKGPWILESTSVFEQERRWWMFPYNISVLMPREELLVQRMVGRLK